MSILRRWEELPNFMKCEEVREYYEILNKKKFSILMKRLFDYILGLILVVILTIPMIILAIIIKLDSPGPVFYRQERITQYGKKFKIHKFRTMVENADKRGESITVDNDSRITRIGKKIRDYRLDELPQVIDVLLGNMSFVGTRPEAVKYLDNYEPEYFATLLLPAGITSEASIKYKDEAKLLDKAADVDKVYIDKILKQKMIYNVEEIRHFSLRREFKTIIKTFFAVFGNR